MKESKGKMLYLINRSSSFKQFSRELRKDKKTKIIDIMTFQHLEQNDVDMNKYTCIIVDEFHYFFTDGKFNKNTDTSLNKILDVNNAIKIFLSATGTYAKNLFKNKGYITEDSIIDYTAKFPELLEDYSYIDNLYFYKSDETILDIMKRANMRNKMIYFCDSVERAYKLHRELKEKSMFVCSRGSKYRKYVDEEALNNMIDKEKFRTPILITTSVLDSGFNIRDKQVKTIITELRDTISLEQSLGRKRRDVGEKVNVYVRDLNGRQLSGMKKNANDAIKCADFLREFGEDMYVDKYSKRGDRLGIVYDDKTDDILRKKINEQAYYSHKIVLLETKLIELSGGYKDFISKTLKQNKYKEVEEIKKQDELEVYLNEVSGNKLDGAGRTGLIGVINLRDNRNRQQKSIKQLNLYLEENKYDYTILAKRNKKERWWQVERLKVD